MNRPFKAYRSLAFALMLGTAAIATTLAPTTARAWDFAGDWTGADGSTWTIWYQTGSDGQTHFAATYEKNGKENVYFDDVVVDLAWNHLLNIANSNPNPDGSPKGTEKPDVAALLKKLKDLIITVKVAPENSPLSQWITSGGFGFAAHGNPGDNGEGQGPGLTPKGNTVAGLTPKQQIALNKLINEVAKSGIVVGQGMGTGDEGGLESAPTLDKNGSSKGKGGDGSGQNNGRNHTIGKTMALGPRPDIINPPLKGGKASMRLSKTGGSTTAISQVGTANIGPSNAGGSKVIAAGLLEGGNGFGQQGPAGIGTPFGAGGSNGTSGAGASKGTSGAAIR